MKENGLNIAVAVSLLFHSIIVIVFNIAIKRNVQYLDTVTYTVDIITPSVMSYPKAKESEIMPAPIVKEPEQKIIQPIETKPEIKKIVQPKPEVEKIEDKIPFDAISPSERISELKESLKRKNKRSAELDESTKIDKIQKIRSLASIRTNKSATETDLIKQSDNPPSGAPMTAEQGDRYYEKVRDYVMGFWSYPDLGKKSMLTIITFAVDINGNISKIKIEKSSGDSLYDAQAKQAVLKSNPLPKPPSEVEIGIRFGQ